MREVNESDFRARGAAFWRLTTKDYELSSTERELLVEVCRMLDISDELQRFIDDVGPTIKGSMGQLRVNPAVIELRNNGLALGRLLSQLQLPDPNGGIMPSPGHSSSDATRAAVARWSRPTPGGA
jgi:hypothetical protein